MAVRWIADLGGYVGKSSGGPLRADGRSRYFNAPKQPPSHRALTRGGFKREFRW
ncbi:MAG: hypothetical protein QM784_13845 [Polyangiaceae bacterium]